MSEIVAIAPGLGTAVGRFTEASDVEVAEVMETARSAAAEARLRPLKERVAMLGRLARVMTEQAEHINRTICDATGKPPVEALASDLLVALDLLRYCEQNLAAALAPRERPTPFYFLGSKSRVEYRPLGVVLVISPWNYPFQLAMAPIITALAAGNAVILKPSEVTPTVGALVGELSELASLPEGLIQVVQGRGDVGQALVEAGPDLVFFTGSAATGSQVMRSAATKLTPVHLELGGKDPMIVFKDANLDRAVNGALYGAFSNAGQACVSVERLYVERRVYEPFLKALASGASKLRLGSSVDDDVGPMINPAQIEVVERHVEDALARGARLLTQRKRAGSYLAPMVLADTDHSMLVMRDETFGPVVGVMPFDSEDEAIELANDSPYGLSASVWTRSASRAGRVAARLDTGSCSINDVMRNLANPHLPFGGTKASGFGRYHGPEGLRSMSRTVAIMSNSSRSRNEINWFPYSGRLHKTLRLLMSTMDDRKLLGRTRRLLTAMGRKVI